MEKNTNQEPDLNLDEFLSHCVIKDYRRQSIVVRQGEKTDKLFLLLKGSVSVIRQHENDKDIVLAYLNQGSFFGEMGLFDPNQLRSATIRAKTACKIAEISYEKFGKLSSENPELMYTISQQLTNRLRSTSKKVSDLAFLDVTGRVAACLLDLCSDPESMSHPDGTLLKVTRQELSRNVGCTREMVGKVIKSLEEQGLVATTGHSIVVLHSTKQD
ncbi:cAMP-activated global transcriptional regulator CRP [Paraneptunicella aestuarii]|uniref:cAMP-activated global transcriptional regulator CRP n=1 Tax=Paraneptunicella aestuarii TaxID=2831148 RepID=UPI0038CD3DD9|nr:cAMP-activated global transcriptional regulator CRP [Paraneptunicella aestuarii]